MSKDVKAKTIAKMSKDKLEEFSMDKIPGGLQMAIWRIILDEDLNLQDTVHNYDFTHTGYGVYSEATMWMIHEGTAKQLIAAVLNFCKELAWAKDEHLKDLIKAFEGFPE